MRRIFGVLVKAHETEKLRMMKEVASRSPKRQKSLLSRSKLGDDTWVLGRHQVQRDGVGWIVLIAVMSKMASRK